MPMNIGSMLKITNAWNTFKRNHPKFPAFCRAVSRKGIREGSILEISYVEEDYALAIKKGNDDLVKKVNDAIKELKEDGTFDKIVAKYITD